MEVVMPRRGDLPIRKELVAFSSCPSGFAPSSPWPGSRCRTCTRVRFRLALSRGAARRHLRRGRLGRAGMCFGARKWRRSDQTCRQTRRAVRPKAQPYLCLVQHDAAHDKKNGQGSEASSSGLARCRRCVQQMRTTATPVHHVQQQLRRMPMICVRRARRGT